MAINRDKVSATAIKLLQSGKYDKAIAEFQRLVEDDPKDVRTLLKLGDTWVKLGNRTEAVAAYQAVADVYSEQGFYLKAVAVFKQMLRVDANLPDVHLQLAEMYQQLGLHSDCMQHYQQVAVHFEREGDIEKTLEVLKRMVDLDPDNLPSRIKLAELFAQQGHSDRALSEFRAAAAYLKQHERFDDYVRVAERLVYFDPSAIDVTRELAQIYLARGEAKLALGKLQTCFKADPRNLETLSLIADAFLAMEQVPKTISVYKEMARIHESTAQVAEAQRHWQRVLDLVPDDVEAQQALGLVGAPAAVTAARPAAAPPPPMPAVDPAEAQLVQLLTETDVYVKYGLRDKAIEHLHKVFSLRPDHIDAHERLRDLYQAMGNRAGLIEELKTLVELGTGVGDPRVGGWERDLALLTSSRPLASVPPNALSPDDSNIIELDESASEDELLLDPALGDEPILDSSGPRSLPPDESVVDEAPFDEAGLLGAGGGDEDLLDVGDDGGMGGHGSELELDAESIIDDAPLSAADLDEIDAMLPSMAPAAVVVPPLPFDAAHSSVGYADEPDLPSATADAVLDDTDQSDLVGLSDALGAELAAAAVAGLDQIGAPQGDFEIPPDSIAAGLGEGENFFNEDAFLAAEQALSGEGDPVPPSPESGEGYASTEIMSLSPDELAEIRAMAQPSKEQKRPLDDLGGLGAAPARVASGNLIGDTAGDLFGGPPPPVDDDFADSTVAMKLGGRNAPPDSAILSDEDLADVASGEYAGHADAFDDGSSYAERTGQPPAYRAPFESPGEDYRDSTDRVTPGNPTLPDLGAPSGLEVPDGALLNTFDLGGADYAGDAAGFDFDPELAPAAAPELSEFDDDMLGEHTVPQSMNANLGPASASSGDPWDAPVTGGITSLRDVEDAELDLPAGGPAAFGLDPGPEATDPSLAPPDGPGNTLEDVGVPSHDDGSEAVAASGDPLSLDGVGVDLLGGGGLDSATGERRTPKLGVSESAYGFEDDPAAAFYPDELEEAEFFIKQELLDEAREILEEIIDDVPDSPRVKWMLARVEAKENGEAEPPAPWASKVIEQVEEEVKDLLDSLGAPEVDPQQVSVEEVLAQFKRGVAATIDEGDAETHYNLGIAYREMGLLDDAIAEFEIAGRAPTKTADAFHLIGLTLVDVGRHEEALVRFDAALKSGDLPKAQMAANEYQIGVCHEALSRPGEALQAYRRAREHGAAQRDIEERIAQMTKALVGDSQEGGAVSGRSANGQNGVAMAAGFDDDDDGRHAHRKKNIDYL